MNEVTFGKKNPFRLTSIKPSPTGAKLIGFKAELTHPDKDDPRLENDEFHETLWAFEPTAEQLSTEVSCKSFPELFKEQVMMLGDDELDLDSDELVRIFASASLMFAAHSLTWDEGEDEMAELLAKCLETAIIWERG